MILSIGEILADMIGETCGESERFTFYAGGAPFNVACCIARLGGESGFVGRVGRDIIGDKLAEFALGAGIKRLALQRDDDRNTTLAFVSLDSDGERSFCFYRKSAADYAIDFREAEKHIREADIVHLGSLMLSEPIGVEFAEKTVAAVKKAGGKLSFDVNYREDIYPDPTVAADISRKYIAVADIVKLSEDEVSLLYGDIDGVKKVAGTDKTVCITLGAEGSICISGGKVYKVPSVKVDVVDTTGAGDAFYGAFLYSLSEGKNISDALRFANVCGALTATKKGAISALPSAEQIIAFSNRVKRNG